MKRKILLLLIIIVILIILLVTTFLIKLEKTEPHTNAISEKEISSEIKKDNRLQIVKTRRDFYATQTCTNKFYLFYIELFNNEEENMSEEEKLLKEEIRKDNAEIVYDMLDEEYIRARGITKDNTMDKLAKISDSYIDITNMYVSEKSNNISVYLVNGILIDKKTSKLTDFQIMIKLDLRNRTFKVLLQDYVNEKYKDLKPGEDIDISVPDIIEASGNNIFAYENISDENYVLDLFEKYRTETMYNKELVYNNRLEKEYKEKKFGTFDEFNTFAKNNAKNAVISQLDKYKKTIHDNYTQYVCIDQKGKYYIFRETAPMNYTVILDTYTIDLPEFTEQYNKASDEDKVAMNIQKFFNAIEDGDYKYAYNKLDSTYKNNNFKTQADFEKYVKQNFFEQNKLSANKAEKQGDIYLYKVNISDKTGKNAKTITKNFVMQLKEGTAFVMSFEV